MSFVVSCRKNQPMEDLSLSFLLYVKTHIYIMVIPTFFHLCYLTSTVIGIAYFISHFQGGLEISLSQTSISSDVQNEIKITTSIEYKEVLF